MAAPLWQAWQVIQAADPRYAERLGVSRREAVRTVSIWGDGALQHAKLRAVAAPGAQRPR